MVSLLFSSVKSLTTCPGFPGYCSESFPGNECNVVCDVGRNNVPLCQEDGTWTDIPRCIEHEPGVEDQIPGLCPGIPGYCAQGFINTVCKFDCLTGVNINSICSPDGTWAPYPTCEGDLRDTKDGCDGCPGPQGGARNRSAEAALFSNTISDRRLPKIIGDNGGRNRIPSFAGNINIGLLNPEEDPVNPKRFLQGRPTPRTAPLSSPRSAPSSTPSSLRRTPEPQAAASQPLTLFDRIKNRINKANQNKGQLAQIPQKPTISPKPKFRKPQQPPPQSFGVFEQVNLQTSGRPNTPNRFVQPQGPRTKPNQQNNGFFGVFPEVKL